MTEFKRKNGQLGVFLVVEDICQNVLLKVNNRNKQWISVWLPRYERYQCDKWIILEI